MAAVPGAQGRRCRDRLRRILQRGRSELTKPGSLGRSMSNRAHPGGAGRDQPAEQPASGSGRGHRDGSRRRHRRAWTTRPGQSWTWRTRVDRSRSGHRGPHQLPGRLDPSEQVLVVENLSRGIRFTRVRVVIDANAHEVVYQTADFHKPWNIGITADPTIQARIDEAQHATGADPERRDRNSTVFIPEADACGRLDLSAVRVARREHDHRCDADRVQDRLRDHEPGGGAGRSHLPDDGQPGRLLPGYTPPPYPISRGQVLGVLPFGGLVVTLSVNGASSRRCWRTACPRCRPRTGASRKCRGCASAPTSRHRVGGRVTGPSGKPRTAIVRAHLSISRWAGVLAENDFMVTGGDGCPNFASRGPHQGHHGSGAGRPHRGGHADLPVDPGTDRVYHQRRRAGGGA